VIVRVLLISGERVAKASAASLALSGARSGATLNAAPSRDWLRLTAHPRITGAPAPIALALPAHRIAEVREDLLGADPDLLWVELEAKCSHDGSNRLLVA
jgi:hypothetical protein